MTSKHKLIIKYRERRGLVSRLLMANRHN